MEENNDYLKTISSGIEQEQAGEYFILHQLNIYNSEVVVFYLAFGNECKMVPWLALHEISMKEQYF